MVKFERNMFSFWSDLGSSTETVPRHRIPESARSVLRRLAPVMLEIRGPNGFAIGRGAAPAARWNHRTGNGIDITLDG